MAIERESGRAEGERVTAIERALDVLNLFGSGDTPSLGVTEVAQALGLSKAVVHRILLTCRDKGFVDYDEPTRRYRLGPAGFRLGLTYLGRIDGLQTAQELIPRLVERTQETATLSVRSGDSRVYVAQRTPDRDIKMVVEVGARFALHVGASSKALLAFIDPDEAEDYLTRLTCGNLPQADTVDIRALRRELEDVRLRGYAVSVNERGVGAASAAAPIFGVGRRVVTVMSVCGPEQRFISHRDECIEALLDVAATTSSRLGHLADT